MERQHRTGASERDPASVLRLVPLFEQQSMSGTRSVRATAVFNDLLQSRMTGFRGASPEPVRQFILRDEEYDIHIKIWGENRKQIRGQLLPRSGKAFPPPARCHLLLNGARLQSTSTDEIGEFQFDEVPEGSLYLQIDLPDLTIVGSLDAQDA